MKAVCMMTGAVLALGTVVPQMSQAVPEAVREEAPRIQVSSTDEFIKVFLTEKLIGRDGKETSRQIETVSETNYASVLAGRDFLKTADPKLKKTIEDGLEQKKIDWKAWCESAETLRKKLEPEKTDKQPESEPKTEDRNQDSALGTGQTGKPDSQTPGALETEKPAENSQSQKQDNQPATDTPAGNASAATGSSDTGTATPDASGDKQASPDEDTDSQDSPNPAGQEAQKPVSTEQEQPHSGPDADGGKNSSGSKEDTVDADTRPVDTSGEKPQAGSGTEESDVLPSGEDKATPSLSEAQPDDPALDTGKETDTIAAPAASQTDREAGLTLTDAAGQVGSPQASAVQQPATAKAVTAAVPTAWSAQIAQANPVVQPAGLSDEAASFIRTWLTSAQGNLYATATEQNQSRILEAMPSWNGLSPEARAMVNQRLQAVNGKTFQKLVREAQQLKLGKPLAWNNTRVHTAARDETGFFVGLMTASGALFAALAGRLKKERRA